MLFDGSLSIPWSHWQRFFVARSTMKHTISQRARFFWYVAIVFACLPTAHLNGQVLDFLRQDVRTPLSHSVHEPVTEKERDHESRSHGHRDCDDDDSHFWIDLLGPVFQAVALTPYWLPRAIANDQGFHPGYFARYPYQDGRPGLMSPAFLDEVGSKLLIRTRIEYADDFDQMTRYGWPSACRARVENGDGTASSISSKNALARQSPTTFGRGMPTSSIGLHKAIQCKCAAVSDSTGWPIIEAVISDSISPIAEIGFPSIRGWYRRKLIGGVWARLHFSMLGPRLE